MEILKTYKEMCEDESICNYCSQTDYGDHKSCISPSGYSCCEGTWCEESYDAYLDNENATENLVKYQNLVKLKNKEEFQ